ncbi:MAG TPA: aromatic-ring-hydroxylating dioxygenase subunit beta [Blastocatellia bacterium]|nr:aromatic-ring-hydroxylating dioxygenase subunit beta [Blastocatellia bacterium]
MANLRELRFEFEELLTDYTQCLDEDRLEEWPDFFSERGVYKLIGRENVEQGLPLATMFCDSRAMMKDRVTAIRRALFYSPRYLRHLTDNLKIVGQEGDAWVAQTNYVVFQTLQDEETKVFNAGKYVDKIVLEDGKYRFKEKIVIYDTVQIPSMIVIPI